MKKSIDLALDVTNEIIERIIIPANPEGGINGIKTSIHPVISNAMFKRDKDLLENERLSTLIALARVLDDDNIKLVVRALGYRLVI